MRKIYIAICLLVLSSFGAFAQNAIVGTGFSNGWGGGGCPTGNGNFKYLSAGVGVTYGVTTTANGTGNQYFRMGVDFSGTTGQYTITPGTDVTVAPNTTYSLNTGCTTSGAMLYSVPNASYNYVFKTLNAGTNPTGTFVFFEVQGAVQSVSTTARTANISNQPVTITGNLSGALSAGQAVYLRYTNDAFTTSTVVQMTGAGTVYNATIPAATNAAGATVSYYLFTSGTANVAANGTNADLYTINILNNGGPNYSYNLSANPITVASTGGTGLPFTTYSTLNAAITAINGGTVHTGTITCYVNAGYTETAPAAAGFVITSLLGTAGTPMTFIKSGTGANPILTAFSGPAIGAKNDAVIKIIGGDYITIDGFTIQENALNTTGGALAVQRKTEFGIGLFALSATDGAQNNTIRNCTISMDATYQNSIGIFSSCASAQDNTALVASSVAGTNSNNKVYNNIINNVAYGIYTISPTNTATVNESNWDIGGTAAATGNNITFGNVTTSDLGFTSFSGTAPAAITFRNGVGNTTRYNTITSSNLAYVQTGGVGGVIYSNGTAPSGITYGSTVSNNTITLSNTSTTAITGIDFGSGITTGTIVGSNNTVTINQNVAAATAGAVTGIKASYTSATNTVNSNNVTLNQTTTAGALSSTTIGITTAGTTTTMNTVSNSITLNQTGSGTGTITGSLTALSVAGVATTNNVQTNTIIVNQTTSVASGITTGTITGILATTAATTLNINTNNTITVKQAVTGAGTYGTNAITYINAGATHGTANVVSNTLNTTGSTIRSTGTLTAVSCEGTVSSLYNIKSNTATIDRVAATGNVFFTAQTTGPSNPADSVSNNTITLTNLATSGTVTGVSQLGGPAATASKSICNNVINFSGTNTGTTKGIAWGYSAGAKVTTNSITITCAAPTVIGLDGTSTSAGGNGGITENILSLTSSTTTPTSIIGITGGGSGPYQIFNNTFTSLNFSGIITGSPIVSGIVVSIGTGNNIYNNNVKNITVGAATSTANPIIDGILITGGTSTNIYKNNIYGLTTPSNGATTTINGIRITGGTTNNIYNNLISGLTAPASTSPDAVRGLAITNATASTAINFHNNTVYLTGTSSGANFGTAAINQLVSATATSAALDLKNNLIVNLCVPTGTGITAIMRRNTAATFGNYATTSNRNSYYAGVPSATNVILLDGATGYQTMGTFQTAVSTREANSFSESTLSYTATSGGAAVQFFTNPNAPLGASYLKPFVGITSQAESGGAGPTTIGFTDDYASLARPVSPGTNFDIGAWEFAGVTPAPSIMLNSISPAATAQCVKAARVVTVTVTNPTPITTTGVVINYSHNGTVQTPVTMTNTSGNIWTGTMLAPTLGNAIVTWNVVATNSISISATYNGTTYADEPTFGAVTTATATPATICSGATSTLNFSVVKPGTSIVGAGLANSNTYPNPFYTNWGHSKNQYLVLASELISAGLAPGNITSLGLNITAAGTALTDFTIQIAPTALTAIPSAPAAFVSSGFVSVYSNLTLTQVLGLNTLTFTTPYNWDGVSNIIIQTCFGNGNTTTVSSTATVDNLAYSSTAHWNVTSTTTGAATCGQATSTNSYNVRPRFWFTGNTLPIVFTNWTESGSPVGATNPLLVTPSTSPTTTYVANATALGCPLTATVNVTVNPLPTSPTISNNLPQCGAAAPSATAVDPNGFTTPTFKWYAAASGGVALQSSTSATYLLSVNTTPTTTLYVSVVNPTTGCESPRTAVVITVNTPPPFTTTLDATICNGAVTPITVTSTIGDFNSYIFSTSLNAYTYLFTDAAGTIAYTGTNLYVDAVTPVTIYFKRSGAASTNAILCTAYNSGTFCGNTATSNQTVMPTPTLSSTGNNYCLTGSPTLSLTPAVGYGAGTIQWQASTDAGASYTNVGTLNSTTYVPGAVTTTTIYKVIVSNSSAVACGTLGSEPSITITVNNPMVTATAPNSRCGTGTVTLGATPSFGDNLNWYAAATGGTSLATGNSFTTPSISATTTYYVGASATGPGAPATGTVGTDVTLTSATTQPTAFCNRWTGYTSQTIYTAAELNAIGIYAGNITSMGFNITTLGDAATNAGYTIKIANTALANATTLGTFATPAFTTVYGPLTYTHTASGLQSFAFSTPFLWNGTSNIIVEIRHSGANSINNSITYYSTTGVAMTSTNTSATSTTGTTTTQRLNTTFTGTGRCESVRTAVLATVVAPPVLLVTAGNTNCNGEIVPLTVTSTLADYDTYIWSPATSLYTDAAATNAYAGSSATTVYFKSTTASAQTITLSSSNTVSGCANVTTSIQTVMPIATITSSSPQICISGTPTLSASPALGYGTGTLQWQSSPDGIAPYADIAGATGITYTPAAPLTATSYYKLIIKNSTGTDCAALNPSPTITIVVNNPMVVSTVPSTKCGAGTQTLAATGSTGATLNWYAAAIGGSAIGTGNSFTTPVISATTNYFVEASTSGGTATVGPVSPTAQGGVIGTQTINWNVNFTTIASTTLQSIDIFPITSGQSGILYVQSGSSTGGPILATINYTTTVGGGATAQTIPINYPLTSGLNYNLYSSLPTSGVSRNTSGGVYPYTSSVANITGNGFDNTYYMGMYNWKFTASCNSARTQVTATVTPAPAITATVSAALVCSGSPTNLNVTSTNDPNYTYTWTPGALSGAAQTVSPTGTTTYIVNASDNTSGTYAGCTATANVLVTVNPKPTVIASATAATICEGNPTILSSVGTGTYNSVVLAQDFNGGSYPGWTVTNATAAPISPAVSNWAVTTGPLTDPSGTATFLNFNTTNGGGFAYANPDAGGSGSTTNTILFSPTFSTLTASASVITFENLYQYWASGDVKAAVEITSDGGATWTVLKDYKTLATSFGTTTNNAQATAPESLTVPAAFLNKPSVSVRFNYVSVWGYFWIFDNFKVTNTLPNNYSWTSSPAGFTSALQNPGSVSPIVSTTYTATITNPVTGCNSSSTVAVTVNPLPTATVTNNGSQCLGGNATFTLTGTPNATVTYNLNGAANTTVTLDAAGSATVTVTAPAVSQTLNLVSALSTASCPKTLTASSTVAINPNGTWTGITSTDWNTTTNWCGNVVPVSTTNVIIPVVASGNYPNILSTTLGVVANNVTILAAGGTTPTIIVGTGATFNLYGNLSGAGTMNATAGTLNLAGTSQILTPSNLSTNTINTLLISSTSSIATGAIPVKVTNQVNFPIPSQTLTTNDNLVLVSNLAGTANLGNVNGGTIVGKVEIQRYLTGAKAWRLLATPVVIATSPTITNSWREGGLNLLSNGFGTRITGPTGPFGVGNNLDEYTVSNSMKYYNGPGNNQIAITAADISNVNYKIGNEAGYFLFVRGDRGADLTTGLGTATTLRIKGEVRTGPQTFSVLANKFASIGNPYPARVDMRTVSFSNLVKSIYVWNPNLAGGFNAGKYELFAYDAVSGDFVQTPGNAVLNTIESGQAFLVQNNTGTAGSLDFVETDKTIGSANVSRPGVNIPTLEINLHTNDVSGNDFVADGVKLNFNNNFNNGLDNLDVKKLVNSFDNIGIKSNATNLIVERKKNIIDTDTIQLNISGMRIAAYKLEIDPSVLATIGFTATLKDRFLHASTPVSLSTVTNVPFDITSDAASRAADRFYIVFRAAPTVNFVSISAIRNADKTANVKYGVQNEINVTNYTIEHSNDGINFTAIATQTPQANNGANLEYPYRDANATSAINWYRVTANTTSGNKYSSIAMVSALIGNNGTTNTEITIYPNPVEGKEFTMRFSNKIGKYNVVILNAEGKKVFNDNITVGSLDVQKRFVLPQTMGAGKYNVIIIGNDGVKQQIPIIVL